jgi:hypothetical protein
MDTKCTCPKKRCKRHDNCDECRIYHSSKKKLPPFCERKKGLFYRLFHKKQVEK